jgi:hypothetical protein
VHGLDAVQTHFPSGQLQPDPQLEFEQAAKATLAVHSKTMLAMANASNNFTLIFNTLLI